MEKSGMSKSMSLHGDVKKKSPSFEDASMKHPSRSVNDGATRDSVASGKTLGPRTA